LNNDWVRFRSIGYLTGKGLSFGASGILPHAAMDLGKYAVNCDVIRGHDSIEVCDEEFGIFAEQSLDFVFVGMRLEDMTDPGALLRELAGKLRTGGHLVVHVKVNAEFDAARTAHYLTEDSVRGMVSKAGAWVQKDVYLRDGQMLAVYKRTHGSRGITLRTPGTRPTACIARYGAIGDMIMITPLIKALYDDGYDVTLNITPYAAPILRYNPYVKNIILQERDAIPNPDLGAYWAEWKGSYDRYINLSESIEGGLLFVEGRREFFTAKSFRHSICNVNYYDRTMALGGYPDRLGHNGEMFFSAAEERDMKKFYAPLRDRFVVLWALNGSSHHKIYPLMEPVMREWLGENPDATLVTLGDKTGKLIEFDHPQVIRKAGEWTIRESMLSTRYAGCVIGPESAIVNGASCFPTPKITLLSHSTRENLTKHWVGDYSLTPDQTLAPCYPCHQLHYTKDSCPLAEIIDENNVSVAAGPACAMGAIQGNRLVDTLNQVKALHRGV
jgi:hypothetical protein